MKNPPRSTIVKWSSTLMLCVLLGGCGSDSSSDEDTINDGTVNTSPVVDAGTAQTVTTGDVVTLSATISDDDTNYTVTWSQLSGTDVTLSDAAETTTNFTAPSVETEETLQFQVSVDDGTNDAVTDTVSITVSAEDEGEESDSDSVWIINTTGEVSSRILDSSTGIGVLVNVQSVSDETVDDVDYTVVTSQGIPKYDVTMTQDIIDGINNRPKASTDLVTGETTASVGDVIEFGEDVGYVSTGDNCDTNAGYGYWPPGPACPTEDEREIYFPKAPEAATEECENGLGKVGLFVNGSSVYNWGDGMSFNSDGSWQNLAPVAEQYDVDICGGHSANGDYHHHFYTSCLADLVGDTGDQHSPIYGFAADGYPIYGPWQDDGVLAVSAWVVRDYSSSSDTGCSDDARSCAMVDQYDASLGTESATQGPEFDDVVETLSGNELVASNGYYYEDYYWNSDLTAQGGAYLDQYNGHTDATRGYHYHITISEIDGAYAPAFPYIIGTRFAGELQDNSVASCSTGTVMGPPPGAG
ncbi:YHYH protein [uncultured Paraglaciecola sp.]|uniref:YHYH protein n=1 Tax=uncultured Paraglaciecola sp. TaxID=1765024 RepID=UPI0030DD1B17